MLKNFPRLTSGEGFLARGVAGSTTASFFGLVALFALVALFGAFAAAFATGDGLKTSDASFSEFSDALFHVFVSRLLFLFYLPSNTTYM